MTDTAVLFRCNGCIFAAVGVSLPRPQVPSGRGCFRGSVAYTDGRGVAAATFFLAGTHHMDL